VQVIKVVRLSKKQAQSQQTTCLILEFEESDVCSNFKGTATRDKKTILNCVLDRMNAIANSVFDLGNGMLVGALSIKSKC